MSLGKRSSGSSRHWDDDDGEDDDIPMIPELDDDDGVDEELAKISAVANAPKAVRRTVMSKAELDHEIRHVVPTAVVDGRTQIDLSILKSSLSPKDAVDEPDVPWVFDSLLQEVSQAMERDAERAAAGGGADGEDLSFKTSCSLLFRPGTPCPPRNQTIDVAVLLHVFAQSSLVARVAHEVARRTIADVLTAAVAASAVILRAA